MRSRSARIPTSATPAATARTGSSSSPGPDARRGAELAGAGIADVAPTVMYLLGEPVPAAFEGRLLAEAIEPALLDERPPEFDDAAEAAPVVAEHESPREVEERLRSLGYLE